ncbi:hypothetical protein [Halalkalibacter lacteus]|uniref:hypothetical protein n=1 Tax=Halalkalibacter lacteus TaxID=3090663 RepID=UPI002FC6631A
MKKKMLVTAATAILTVGVLAACGDSEEPTLNEDANLETEVEMDGGAEGTEMDEGVEEFPEEEGTDTEEFDTDFGTEEEGTEEFDTEFDAETDDSEEDVQ